MTVKTSNYRLKTAHNFYTIKNGSKTIPSGSYVKPVEVCYLPVHIKQDSKFAWFDPVKQIYCYTQYGFLAINKDNLEET